MRLLQVAALLIILLGGLTVAVQQGYAEPQAQTVSNETCLECHSDPTLSMPLEDGELLPLFVDPEVFAHSIHGEEGYACVQCHTDLGDYPHPTYTAANRREVSLQLYNSCERCHSGQYEKTLDSVHDLARVEGNPEAAVCTDCHGAHNTQRLTDPETHELLPEARTQIPNTCARCHNAIFEKYQESVHGSALIGEGNPDVATCIDCHGVHNIEAASEAEFRLKSPQICAECHTDEERMAEYGLSTQVLDTYVADFHGSTVTLFEQQTPDAETNKPVCFDCHGVHDIRAVDDPEKGIHVRENLLARCQQCHPDASSSFPDAWLSHYIPSREETPIVWLVDRFYDIFIPLVLGGLGLLVVLDFSWQVRKRVSKRREGNTEASADNREAPPEEQGNARSEDGS